MVCRTGSRSFRHTPLKALSLLLLIALAVTAARSQRPMPTFDATSLREPAAAYQAICFHMPAGSRLTFYSDGVVEAQNQKGELFGFDRGRELSTQSAAAIVEAARQFGQSDDITVVAIQRAAAIANAA